MASRATEPLPYQKHRIHLKDVAIDVDNARCFPKLLWVEEPEHDPPLNVNLAHLRRVSNKEQCFERRAESKLFFQVTLGAAPLSTESGSFAVHLPLEAHQPLQLQHARLAQLKIHISYTKPQHTVPRWSATSGPVSGTYVAFQGESFNETGVIQWKEGGSPSKTSSDKLAHTLLSGSNRWDVVLSHGSYYVELGIAYQGENHH